MAKAFLILLSLLSLLKADDSATLGKLKADRLRSLSSAQDNVVFLSPETFTEFVVEQPRPYTLVVLFTTTSSKYKCTSCEEIMGMFYQVAYSYKLSGADLPSATGSGQKLRAVFFAVLDYNQKSHSLFQKFGFVSVPNILITHPKSVLDEGTKFAIHKEDLWEFNQNSEVHTQKIMDFVNSRSQRTVELKTSTLEAIVSLVYSLMAIGMVGYMVYVLRRLLMIPYVWFAGGMLIYFICMAGVVYDIIHGVPWVGANQKGEPEFINSGQRSQYGLEGFLMSFTISVAGISFVGLNLVAKMNNAWNMRTAACVCLIVLFLSVSKILQIYRVKANWYSPGMAPPAHYVKGPLIRDQGNSF